MSRKPKDIPAVFRVHCNRCNTETVHDVLAGTNETLTESVGDDGKQVSVAMHLRLVCMCAGCGTTCMASVLDDWGAGALELQVKTLPPRVVRKMPHWHDLAVVHASWDIPGIFNEIYAALQSDAFRLAAMGIRAALEQAIVETVGDQGTFKENLNKFQESGYISSLQRNAIERVLEVGHAAIHRSHKPTQQDVFSMLDILENLMQALYVNTPIAKAMSVTPPRKTTSKSAKTATQNTPANRSGRNAP